MTSKNGFVSLQGQMGAGKALSINWKSTLYKLLQKRVSTEPFVNADQISRWLAERGVVNLLTTFGITSDEASFKSFMDGKGKSWIEKATKEGVKIKLTFSDNNLLAGKSDSIGYDAATAADFIRYQMIAMEY